jgi:uncharacterized membrane protein
MYPNVHGITGALCTLGTFAVTKDVAISAVAGGVLAFLSHDLLDRLGEKKYKNLLYYEAVFFFIFCFLAWKSDLTILYFIGWFAGNLMDFIDKKGGLSIYNLKKYPYGTFFSCHRRKPNFDLNATQTILISILATLILIAL